LVIDNAPGLPDMQVGGIMRITEQSTGKVLVYEIIDFRGKDEKILVKLQLKEVS